MKIDVLTLFPQMFDSPFAESIIKRGVENGALEIKAHQLRDWAEDKHKTVDLPPYGGGPGMVMKVDVIDRAIEALKEKNPKARVVLMDTKGTMFDQKKAIELSKLEGLIFICGHYEGVDHRVHENLVDETITIGEYVLTGGELPAMVVIDTLARLIPGVVGNPESLSEESYQEGAEQEYPQYTRPETYKGWKVPEILLSGDHAKIKKWRSEMKKK